MQHRPGAGSQGGQVRLVWARQALGFGNACRELLPADRGCDRSVQVGAARLGVDQGRPELGEQAHLVVDRPSIAQDGILLACFGAAKHAADGTVEKGHAVIGQAHGRVQDRGDEGGAAAKRREHAQMLGGEAPTFARQFAQPFGVDAVCTGGIEAGRAQAGKLFGKAAERLVARRAWRLACPGQHAHRRALLGSEQRVQCLGLCWGQAAGELARDVSFGQHEGGGNQALDGGWPGHDDPTPPQFVQECVSSTRYVRVS